MNSVPKPYPRCILYKKIFKSELNATLFFQQCDSLTIYTVSQTIEFILNNLIYKCTFLT